VSNCRWTEEKTTESQCSIESLPIIERQSTSEGGKSNTSLCCFMSVSEVMCPIPLQLNKENAIYEGKNADALEWSAYRQGGYSPSK